MSKYVRKSQKKKKTLLNKTKKKKKSGKKKILGIVSITSDSFNAELALQILFLDRQHWMVYPAHEKTKHVCMLDIESAIGPQFTDAFTMIYTADSRIIFPTFQRFKRRF